MLQPVFQQPSAQTNLSGLAWGLSEELTLSVQGTARVAGQTHTVGETTFDLTEQPSGPLFLYANGVVAFSAEGAPLAHLGYWDGTDFTYIDHSNPSA